MIDEVYSIILFRNRTIAKSSFFLPLSDVFIINHTKFSRQLKQQANLSLKKIEQVINSASTFGDCSIEANLQCMSSFYDWDSLHTINITICFSKMKIILTNAISSIMLIRNRTVATMHFFSIIGCFYHKWHEIFSTIETTNKPVA